MKIAIIGSGISGIASAIRLKIAGHDVHVFEASSSFGGKMAELQMDGFRFDKGPSLFTMPAFVDELFHLAGRNPRDYFNYERLAVACKYFDGEKQITAFSDKTKLIAQEKKNNAVLAENLENYLNDAASFYDLSKDFFVERQETVFSLKGIKMAIHALRKGLFGTLNKFNQRIPDATWQKVFNRFATYNGSNPFKSPAVLSCIAALEHTKGAYFPKGGMRQIVASLFTLATEIGVEFHFNCGVKRIEKSEEKWSVFVKGSDEIVDVIVNAGDEGRLGKLFAAYKQKEKRDDEYSSSALVFYWGMNKQFKELELHNIFFAEQYEAEFEAMSKMEVQVNDLSVYVHVCSKVEAEDAPEGMESWFVMVNVPPRTISNEERKQIRKSVIEKLESVLGEKVASSIVAEEYLDPLRIEQNTYSVKGALYGANSNSIGSIMKRPKQRTNHKGLYNVGGTVFPGGGIPLCLKSAEQLQEIIKNDYA